MKKIIGSTKFLGDKMPDAWSVNSFFTIGEKYIIYEQESIKFLIGNNGEEYKYLKSAWSEILPLNRTTI